MLDRIRKFLTNLPGEERSKPTDDAPRLAAAALLFHVIDADGVRGEEEMKRLRALVADTYGISGRELDELVAAAEEADRAAVDLYSFTSVLNRHLDQKAKIELISIMWELVFADGDAHELEDNVVWRVAELIGVEREERIAMRRRSRGKPAAEDGA